MTESGYHLFEKDRSLDVSDGTPIGYTVRGAGDTGVTFVLANGWACSDAYWALLVPHLAERGHRVILPDTRGHGASGLPRRPGYRARNLRPEDLSLERVSADLLELCDAEGVEQAVLVGHSMGVQTILEAYRQQPDRVEALVCVAGPYENPLRTFMGVPQTDRLFPIAKVALHAVPRLMLPAWHYLGTPKVNHKLARRLAMLIRATGPRVTERALAPYIEHLTSRDPLVMFKLAESMRNASAADLLPLISVPTLILAGGRDSFTPLPVQRRMQELVPESELVVFPESHHTLPLEEPDGVHAAIDRFVAERLLPRRAARTAAGS